MIVLFDLAMPSDSRPSPFCWRARLALRHKGVPFEARATSYSDIPTLGDGSFKTLPVIDDAGVWSGGSSRIASDLESRYPDRPTLFPDDPQRRLAEFVESWVDTMLHPQIFPMVALKIWKQLRSAEKDYFRSTRERRLGMTLEEAYHRHGAGLPAVRATLDPLRHVLKQRAFLAGAAPAYADYIVYGALKWYRMASGTPLIEASDPVAAWVDRIDEHASS